MRRQIRQPRLFSRLPASPQSSPLWLWWWWWWWEPSVTTTRIKHETRLLELITPLWEKKKISLPPRIPEAGAIRVCGLAEKKPRLCWVQSGRLAVSSDAPPTEARRDAAAFAGIC